MENKTFEQLRKEQLSLLSGQMTRYKFGITGKGRFFVYPYEANLGKTYTLINTLKSMYEWMPDVKTLVVSKFKGEGNHIASSLPNAIAVNTDNNEVDEDDLEKYHVVVITHQKYKILCKDAERRQKFIKGRHTLIIDEELNLLNMDTLSSVEISRMETILKEITAHFNVYSEDKLQLIIKEDLGTTYKDIIAGLERKKNTFIKAEMKFFYYEDFTAILLIDRLKELVEGVTFAKNYCNHLEYKYGIKTSKDKVLMKLEMLKKYFNNPKVIASNKTLYTYDNSIQYFTLENNIILDASAKFHTLYSISDMFQVVNSERIVNHSNWTIHTCYQNSTAYHKHHNDNFYGDVVNFILNHYEKDDQILLLGLEEDIMNLKKEYAETLEELNIDMENFQAMRGKNEWEDFNKCIIIHNPAMSNAYYAFEYMLYTREELTDDDLCIQKINKNMGFTKNPILESLRKTDIVSNIYQGLKRINRGTERLDRKADVYILNSDEGIHNLVIEQLKDVNKNSIPFHDRPNVKKERNQKGYDNDAREANANNILKNNATTIKEYFIGLSNGEYKKKNAREVTGITNRKAFNKAFNWLIECDCSLSNLGIEWNEKSKKFKKVDTSKINIEV